MATEPRTGWAAALSSVRSGATGLRCTAAGMGYSLGGVPLLLAPPPVERYGGMGVACYLSALGVISTPCLLRLKETRGVQIDGPEPPRENPPDLTTYAAGHPVPPARPPWWGAPTTLMHMTTWCAGSTSAPVPAVVLPEGDRSSEAVIGPP